MFVCSTGWSRKPRAQHLCKGKRTAGATDFFLYGKLKNPVMTGLDIKLSGVRMSLTYPETLPDLFDGDQILLVGRYDRPGPTHIVVTGDYLGRSQTFEYAVNLARISDKYRYNFVEPLWAVRRIGHLLDQIQLNGRSTEVVDELVRLSKQYGIITPYTSFLADERTRLDSIEELRRKGEMEAKDLGVNITGGMAQVAAANRAALNQATVAPAQSGVGGAVQIGQSNVQAYEANRTERIATVQNAGRPRALQRGRQWIDSSVVDTAAGPAQLTGKKPLPSSAPNTSSWLPPTVLPTTRSWRFSSPARS